MYTYIFFFFICSIGGSERTHFAYIVFCILFNCLQYSIFICIYLYINIIPYSFPCRMKYYNIISCLNRQKDGRWNWKEEVEGNGCEEAELEWRCVITPPWGIYGVLIRFNLRVFCIMNSLHRVSIVGYTNILAYTYWHSEKYLIKTTTQWMDVGNFVIIITEMQFRHFYGRRPGPVLLKYIY